MFFFFNDTATTEIYTLSLHDALPIWSSTARTRSRRPASPTCRRVSTRRGAGSSSRTPPASWPESSRPSRVRSEEHTSELQSRQYLVCRLLLEKKKYPGLRHRL